MLLFHKTAAHKDRFLNVWVHFTANWNLTVRASVKRRQQPHHLLFMHSRLGVTFQHWNINMHCSKAKFFESINFFNKAFLNFHIGEAETKETLAFLLDKWIAAYFLSHIFFYWLQQVSNNINTSTNKRKIRAKMCHLIKDGLPSLCTNSPHTCVRTQLSWLWLPDEGCIVSPLYKIFAQDRDFLLYCGWFIPVIITWRDPETWFSFQLN